MQVEFKTDELIPCLCGFKPDHYTVGYGTTPYDVFCPNCKKQAAHTKYKITGPVDNMVHYWNNHVAKMTTEQLNREIEASKVKRSIEDPENDYTVYQWYWWSHKEPTLTTKCRP